MTAPPPEQLPEAEPAPDRVQRRAWTEVSRVETWLLDQGVPSVVRYAAGQRIIERMAPGLVLILFSGLGLLIARLLSGDLDRPFWQVLASTDFTTERAAIAGAAIFVGLVLGIAAASAISRIRDRRARRFGSRVGAIAVYSMLAICAGHGLISGSFGAFLAEIGTFAFMIAVLFFFVRGGLSALLVWAARRAVPRYQDLVRLLTRALPLQLVLVAFLFLSSEPWQVSDRLNATRLTALMVFFVVAALAFLITQIPRELSNIAITLEPAQIERSCRDTPLERLASIVDVTAMHKHPLSAKERLNLVLNVMFTQGLQVLSLGVLMFVILVIFGVIAIDPTVLELWVGRPPEALVVFGLVVPLVTVPLLKVATIVSSFTALQFAVQAVTDATYRGEFFDDVIGQLSDTLVAREVYLAGLEQHELTPSSRRFSWRELAESDPD